MELSVAIDSLKNSHWTVKVLVALLIVTGVFVSLYTLFAPDDPPGVTVILPTPDPDTSTTGRFTHSTPVYSTTTDTYPSGVIDNRYSTHKWAPLALISSSALQPAGREDGINLYVAIAWFNGEWIPGKAKISGCWIIQNDVEYYYSASDCQVLTWKSETLSWLPVRNRTIPEHSLVVDPFPVGERLYVCRGWWEGQLIVGKTSGTLGVCIVSADGEQRLGEFEVLVQNACERQFVSPPYPKQNVAEWVWAHEINVSDITAVGQQDELRVYVSRAKFRGSWVPGKAHLDQNGKMQSIISYMQQEYYLYDFQVLRWPPQKAVWVKKIDSIFPERAIEGGEDPETGELIYTCRGFFENNLIVGKTLRSSNTCTIPFYGVSEISEYEVFVENACDPPPVRSIDVHYVVGGGEPSGKVEDRYSAHKWAPLKNISESELQPSGYSNGKNLYVTRAYLNGEWLPGMGQASGCWIIQNGKEYYYAQPNCQVLTWQLAKLNWVSASGNSIPQHSLAGDDNPQGEKQYICRAWWGSRMIVGKAQRSLGMCFIIAPDGIKGAREYEVLVKNGCEKQSIISTQYTAEWVWVQMVGISELPYAGRQNEKNLYVSRTMYDEKWVPGKAHVDSHGEPQSIITVMGTEHYSFEFQVLVWKPQKVVWAKGGQGYKFPTWAIEGGLDYISWDKAYICRGYYNNYLIVGRTTQNSGICSLPFYGEQQIHEYEVLTENVCDPILQEANAGSLTHKKSSLMIFPICSFVMGFILKNSKL